MTNTKSQTTQNSVFSDSLAADGKIYKDTKSCFLTIVTNSDTVHYFSPPGEGGLPLAPPSAPPPTSDTSSGFDLNTVPRPSLTKKAKVLYDYDAAEKNELSLLADEVSDCKSKAGSLLKIFSLSELALKCSPLKQESPFSSSKNKAISFRSNIPNTVKATGILICTVLILKTTMPRLLIIKD